MTTRNMCHNHLCTRTEHSSSLVPFNMYYNSQYRWSGSVWVVGVRFIISYLHHLEPGSEWCYITKE